MMSFPPSGLKGQRTSGRHWGSWSRDSPCRSRSLRLRLRSLRLVVADQNLLDVPQESEDIADTENVAEASVAVERVRPSLEHMIDHKATPGGRSAGLAVGEVEVVEVGGGIPDVPEELERAQPVFHASIIQMTGLLLPP